MDDDYILRSECILHREVIDAKMMAAAATMVGFDKRIDGILEEIKEVRQLQKNIQWMLLFIAVGTICTLMGVLLGRGFDFGWIVP